jgi:hypothetical protein
MQAGYPTPATEATEATQCGIDYPRRTTPQATDTDQGNRVATTIGYARVSTRD